MKTRPDPRRSIAAEHHRQVVISHTTFAMADDALCEELQHRYVRTFFSPFARSTMGLASAFDATYHSVPTPTFHLCRRVHHREATIITENASGPVELRVPAEQRQSLLFSLPLEIRRIIYELVFGPSLIHIEAVHGRLAHVRYFKWSPGRHRLYKHSWTNLDDSRIILSSVQDPNDQLLGPSLSCRLM